MSVVLYHASRFSANNWNMKKIIYYIAVTLSVLPISNALSQDSGNSMYDESVLHEIRFDFEEANFWNILRENFEENFDPMAIKPYLMGKVTIDGEVVDSVGVRFKGFTSYSFDSDKKPIKIDFNEFVPGKRYDGLRKLNLNNSTGDPSMQRDPICYDLMRSLGVDAPRTSYSKVYFNDEYWGLYQTIEQVDKEFIQNNFSFDDGNLFKNLGWSKFEWLGTDKSSYKEIFSLKTNKDLDDWTGFVTLIDFLNFSSDDEFANGIEDIFNVDLFLKTLAVDVATNNWDSYLEHGRNWYMYEDTDSGIFHWIPWDYNFSFPAGSSSGDDCSLFSYFVSLPNGTPELEFFNNSSGDISDYEWDFGDGTSSTEENPVHTFPTNGNYTVCLTVSNGPECSSETCMEINTSVNLSECPSIVNGTFPHEVGATFATVLSLNPSCCEVWGEDCENHYNWLSGSGGGFGSGDFMFDQRENEGVLINRLLNEEKYFERYLSYACTLMNNHFIAENYDEFIDQNKLLIEEAVESDPNALFSFSDFLLDNSETGIKLLFQNRIDSLQLELNEIQACQLAENITFQDVVVNEFVASNDSTSTIKDPAGEYDDWIELYNNTSETIDLSQAFLSDDPEDLLKWQFPPASSISPNSYLIVWADKDDTQDGLHCDFKLKKSGDAIHFSNADESVIDEIVFSEQETNIASARVPNGTGDFISQASTFNANNDTSTATNNLEDKIKLKLYPNPATELLTVEISEYKNESYALVVYSAAGQQVILKDNLTSYRNNLDVKDLSTGFYFIHIIDEQGNKSIAKFAKMN